MRVAVILILVIALLPTLAWADLSVGEWKTARAIVLPQSGVPGLVYLPLDEQALAGVKSLSEYRIARAGRMEMPYRMVLEQGETETEEIPATVVSRATLGDEKAQLVVDCGSEGRRATAVEFALRGGSFRARVEVEGSSDRGEWWRLSDETVLYRQRGLEQGRVALPGQQFRFLRFTLVRLEGKLPEVERARVLREVTIPRRLVAVPAKVSRREDNRKRRTVLDLHVGELGWDLAEARFEVEEAAFDRAAVVEVGARVEGEEPRWEYRLAMSGRLRRVEASKGVVLPLSILHAARLRISIYNGDDAPLAMARVTLWRVRRGLIFAADPAYRYELWYGNPKAAPPMYDIQRLPLTAPPAKLPQAALRTARQMALKPPPPPPWSERHPAVLWAVLAVVVVLLTIVIVRAMRGVKSMPPGS